MGTKQNIPGAQALLIESCRNPIGRCRISNDRTIRGPSSKFRGWKVTESTLENMSVYFPPFSDRSIHRYSKLASLAKIIVYSMAPDGPPFLTSSASTPWASGMNTPFLTPEPEKDMGDYLTARLERGARKPRIAAYLAGSRALDSLARLIVETESFFHPNNSGSWTNDVSELCGFSMSQLLTECP